MALLCLVVLTVCLLLFCPCSGEELGEGGGTAQVPDTTASHATVKPDSVVPAEVFEIRE